MIAIMRLDHFTASSFVSFCSPLFPKSVPGWVARSGPDQEMG
ncbi:MAG: hypothetical protein ABF856_12985 [Acetobacter aceti]